MNLQVWAGYNRLNWYLTPKCEPVDAAGHWFTNIPISNRPEMKNLKFVPLDEIPERYKKIDDSGILCIDNNFIPIDYEKPFAVSSRPILNGLSDKGYKTIHDTEIYPYFMKRKAFICILIQNV